MRLVVVRRGLVRPGADEPVEQPEGQRDHADPDQGFKRRGGEVEQDDLARDDEDRDQHDDARLKNAGPPRDREGDRVIELDQDEDGEDGAEHVLEHVGIHEGDAEPEVIGQLDRHQDQRIDDHHRDEQHDDARDDLLETLVGREVLPLPLQGREIQHGFFPWMKNATTAHRRGAGAAAYPPPIRCAISTMVRRYTSE